MYMSVRIPPKVRHKKQFNNTQDSFISKGKMELPWVGFELRTLCSLGKRYQCSLGKSSTN